MTTQEAELPISQELLDILRCPLAVQSDEHGDDPGRLELVHNSWLVSADSGLKYPIRDGIPVMLIEEGMKWKDVAVEDLPVPPPPAEGSSPVADTATRTAEATPATKEKTIALKPAKLLIVLAVIVAVVVLLKKRKG